jgi:hypothetical protein
MHMSIIDNIKTSFNKNKNHETTEQAPEGICPNCWGNQNWDGDFYEVMKGNKNDKRDDTYNNFINKIVETNISGITIHKDTYTCKTCQIKYKHEH